MGDAAGEPPERLEALGLGEFGLEPFPGLLGGELSALGIGQSVGGNVVVETVFSWPGLGRMLVEAVASSDYPLAQGAFLMITTVLVTMNFVADLLYSLLDPRIAHAGHR